MWKIIVKMHRKSNMLKCKDVSRILSFHLPRKNIAGLVESFGIPIRYIYVRKGKLVGFAAMHQFSKR